MWRMWADGTPGTWAVNAELLNTVLRKLDFRVGKEIWSQHLHPVSIQMTKPPPSSNISSVGTRGYYIKFKGNREVVLQRLWKAVIPSGQPHEKTIFFPGLLEKELPSLHNQDIEHYTWKSWYILRTTRILNYNNSSQRLLSVCCMPGVLYTVS